MSNPIFLSFASPWTPKLLEAQSCLYPIPAGRVSRRPSEIRDPRVAKPLCFGTYQSQILQDSLLHPGDRGTLPALAGAGAGRFWGLTAPWHGMRAGKKSGILACDIDLVSSERVNEIHTSCKTPQVGSIGLFLVKTISSESLPLLQNHFFLLL